MTDVEASSVLTPPETTKKVDSALVSTESPEHWPALSDSIRTSAARSSLTDSFKTLSIGSINTSPQGKKVEMEKESEATSMSKPNLIPQSPTNVGPNRQNSMNRNSSRNNNNKVFNTKLVDVGMFQVQSAPGSPSVLSHSGSGSSIGESSVDSSRKNGAQRNEQHPFRRSHSGPLSRGDNRGNARDDNRGNTQDRRRKDWGSRSFGSRENHSQQHTGYRSTATRGLSPAPYVPYQVQPVAFQPYSPQMGYQGMNLAGVHAPQLFFIPGPLPEFPRPALNMIPQMPFPVPDPELSSRILKQIEYYFSDDNLVKDWFLRKQMDGEGWVPINLVAGFRMVAQLTEDIQLIMEALRASNAVEVQGDKLRRKTDWARWIPRPE